MKRVMILAYDFPPYNSIGGQRPYSWYRHLKEFNIEPVVVTRHWDIEINGPEDCYLPSISRKVTIEETEYGTIIRAPFTPLLRDNLIKEKGNLLGLIRKGLTVWQMMTEHSLPTSDSRHSIYLAAKNYLKKNKVDAIIATGEPFILFSHAYRLSKEFNTPWVADYRDGWSTNYHMSESSLQRWIQNKIHLPIEQKMVATSSHITTAAPSISKDVAGLLNGKKTEVIYNGYFEEKFENLVHQQPKETFTIAHAGTVYPYQKVETFLAGLRTFISENPEKKLEVVFFGLNFQPDQINRIKENARDLPVKFTDRMPHDEMLTELSGCQALLLLATSERHQIYAKVFDYLALQKPIIMVENDHGPLGQMLNAGDHHIICDNANEVEMGILKVIEKSSLNIESAPDMTFTRRFQAKRLSELLIDL